MENYSSYRGVVSKICVVEKLGPQDSSACSCLVGLLLATAGFLQMRFRLKVDSNLPSLVSRAQPSLESHAH